MGSEWLTNPVFLLWVIAMRQLWTDVRAEFCKGFSEAWSLWWGLLRHPIKTIKKELGLKPKV
jgi:hypothetical protein